MNLTDDELGLLSRFDASPNVRGVAMAMGVPRSTVSVHLSAIEEKVGRELFLRKGKRLVPTQFGTLLLESARKLVESRLRVDEVIREGTAVGERLTVAVSPLFAETVLGTVIETLKRTRPHLRLALRLSHDYADLFEGRIDVALRRGPLPSLESIGARPLGKTTLVCVASADHPVLQNGDVRQLVEDLTWIRVGSRLEPQTVTLMTEAGRVRVVVAPTLAVDSQRLGVELALRGCGVVRANWFFVREHVAAGRLREVLPAARSTEMTYAVYPRGRRITGPLRAFLDVLSREARALAIWDGGQLT